MDWPVFNKMDLLSELLQHDAIGFLLLEYQIKIWRINKTVVAVPFFKKREGGVLLQNQYPIFGYYSIQPTFKKSIKTIVPSKTLPPV